MAGKPPDDYVFGGQENRQRLAREVDRDLAENTRGPIRPVRESDLGRKTDLDIALGALGGRHTVTKPATRRRQSRPATRSTGGR